LITKNNSLTQIKFLKFFSASAFTPLEIMPRCSAAELDFRIIPAGFNAPLEFLTGFTADEIGLFALSE
jgi:hypothetical protein